MFVFYFSMQRVTRGTDAFHFEGFWTLARSSFPLRHLVLTPGQSLSLPFLMRTTLCSCKLWPSPGTKAVSSFPLFRRTKTHLRLPELGLRGFRTVVLMTTPFVIHFPSLEKRVDSSVRQSKLGEGKFVFTKQKSWMPTIHITESSCFWGFYFQFH